MKNKISIIVPVYNRANEIDDFLNSFNRQTEKDFEILIVDDGSEDNLKEVISKYNDNLDISYFYQQNQGPGKARNRGMENAKGDYFVFIDSDCTVPKNYIENLQQNIKSTDIDAFGGPDTFREDFSPFLKAVNYSMTSFLGTGGTRGSTGKSVGKYYPRSFNMGIKREIFENIGGMNDLRHGQDMDFSNRIHNNGYKVAYFDNIPVYHKRRTDLRRFFKQVFNWGVTRINLGRIDKKMLKPIHFLPSLAFGSYFLIFILMFFSPFFKILFIIESLGIIGIADLAFFQATKKYGSTKIGLLSILTLFTQVFAYGSGLVVGLLKSINAKDGEWINGFTKKYYK